MNEKVNSSFRIVITAILLVMIIFVFIARIFYFQIIDGDKYYAASHATVTKTQSLAAVRGEIYDSYGRPLVVNSLGLDIQFTKANAKDEEINRVINEIIEICINNSDEYYDTLPITAGNKAQYAHTTASGEPSAAFLKFLKNNNYDKEITADNLLLKLYDQFEIDTSVYSATQARNIAGVRYEMQVRGFSKSVPYVFAEDISIKTASKISENKEKYSFVSIEKVAIRSYNTNAVGSNIIGRVGRIYAEEYAQLKDKGYLLSDIVGKDGAEKAFEDTLKGKNGSKKTITDRLGNIVSEKITEPVPGNSVTLTVDWELQAVCEKALADAVADCIEKGKKHKYKYGEDAKGAAVVVLDVNTGAVIAMANYPTYDIETVSANYNALINDPLKPLFNRSISGTYAPGSTYKVVTATAALCDKVLEVRSKFTCTGVYRFYASSGYTPACYNKTRHGTLDIVTALEKSCNSFFFDAGRLMGIATLEEYAAKFGLGAKTGIELLGEASGVIAGKTNSQKYDKLWTPGNTIQAAIGQSDNRFTPIQLASMAATIANGGTVYKTSVLKSIRNNYTGEIVYDFEPQINNKINYGKDELEAIQLGMKKVVTTGTASSAFRGFDIELAGKTGTAEVNGSPNIVFAGYAPYDKPEIAIAIVIENGGVSANLGTPVKTILSAYFEGKKDIDSSDMDSVILN